MVNYGNKDLDLYNIKLFLKVVELGSSLNFGAMKPAVENKSLHDEFIYTGK